MTDARTSSGKTKRWPGAIRDLLAKYPASSNVVQVRVASHDGSIVTFEGRCTKEIADTLMVAMFGEAMQDVANERARS